MSATTRPAAPETSASSTAHRASTFRRVRTIKICGGAGAPKKLCRPVGDRPPCSAVGPYWLIHKIAWLAAWLSAGGAIVSRFLHAPDGAPGVSLKGEDASEDESAAARAKPVAAGKSPWAASTTSCTPLTPRLKGNVMSAALADIFLGAALFSIAAALFVRRRSGVRA